MSTPPTNNSTARIAFAGPETRASDTDRESVVRLLNDAFAEGRLSAGEHEQRISAAYAARTWQQLRPLTADLPAPEPVGAGRPAAFSGADLCLLCLLLIVCPPAGIAWWLLSRRRLPLPPDGDGPADERPALWVGGEYAKDR